MRLPKLDIITGDVVNVQLTSETHVRGAEAASKGRRRGVSSLQLSSRVLNRMRVFVMTVEGKERDFTFTNSTVGVREGHRVSIVRADPPRAKEPVIVLLHNHTTGQREELTHALSRAVGQRVLGARWRALGAALVAFLGFGALAMAFPDRVNLITALVFAGLSFPVLWGVFAGLDALILPARERDLADRIRAEIEGRLKAMDALAKPAA